MPCDAGAQPTNNSSYLYNAYKIDAKFNTVCSNRDNNNFQ